MSGFSRRDLLKTAAAAAAVGGCVPETEPDPSSEPAGEPPRPNVLVVMLDQLRYHALSMYGEVNLQTPVQDQLMLSGVHFPRTYTPNPVCSPARGGFLTTQHPHRVGIRGNFDKLEDEHRIWPEILADAGYRCGWVGKWHLSPVESYWVDNRRCFDWWKGFNMGHFYRRSVWFEGTEPVVPDPPSLYQPAYQTDHALEFMDEMGDAPWLLVVSYGPPHPNGSAPSNWLEDVPPKWFQGLAPKDLVYRDNVPQKLQSLDPNRPLDGPTHLIGYYAALASMDHFVDVLISGLEERGLRENTLVIFTSDHGELGLSHGMYGKSTPHEESVRIPLGFSWPGVISPAEVEVPSSLLDIGPTVLGLLELDPMEEADGLDLSPFLRGEEAHEVRDGCFYAGAQDSPIFRFTAFATPTLKVARTADLTGLWDLENDPYETVNLAQDDSWSDTLDEMLTRLDQAEAEAGYNAE